MGEFKNENIFFIDKKKMSIKLCVDIDDQKYLCEWRNNTQFYHRKHKMPYRITIKNDAYGFEFHDLSMLRWINYCGETTTVSYKLIPSLRKGRYLKYLNVSNTHSIYDMCSSDLK